MLINSFFNKIPDIPDIPILSEYTFDSIIDLPENIHIHDFRTKNIFQNNKHSFSIGKYNEKRYNMYKGKLFEKTNRFIHMGIDIGAPIGTVIKSFYDGEIFYLKITILNWIMVIQLLLSTILITRTSMLFI